MKIAIATNCPQDTVNYIAAFRSLGTEPENVTDECDPERFAGLVLPGGADVDPLQYGAFNTACGELDPELDRIQMKTLKKFLDAGKPVFGICRGQQLLNVFFGGTLIQNLPTASLHARDQGVPADKIHHQTAVEVPCLKNYMERHLLQTARITRQWIWSEKD